MAENAFTVLQLNSGNFGSTGTIARGIGDVAASYGIESVMAYPESRSAKRGQRLQDIIVTGRVGRNIHRELGYLTGRQGAFSNISTRRFLDRVRELRPDVLHLHNLHDSYINVRQLFEYIKTTATPVVWTLHDCWALTGKCTYYTMVGCEKWRATCSHCPQLDEYPRTLVDCSAQQHGIKRALFADVTEMVIVTPSEWLRSQVAASHLGSYDVRVINNGIDLDVYRPSSSNFRSVHNIGENRIVLGVALGWSRQKGFAYFLDLRERLDDKYTIVLVGLSDNEIADLPDGIIGLSRTKTTEELAQIYSAADVFFNPTLEDNFPTVNLEALACGTPVVAFESGGATEAFDSTCGIGVAVGDMHSAVAAIRKVAGSDWSRQCIQRARSYRSVDRFGEYAQLYQEIARKRDS